MAKRVFISFNFQEKGYQNDMRNLFAGLGGRVEATPTVVENDASAGGPSAIKAEIQRIMGPCRGLIVVVGDVAHNSPWIDYELGYANSQGIPKIGVRHPNATGGVPNNHRGMKVVEWNSQELIDTVRGW
ncbi:TIR domain-containing protein [Corallococcus exiguus]|uniref:TIR domain-containing protein n=1 Tax=Corallococcus exiguus TaxID=83462 RepID=UPI003DA4435B